MALEPPKPEEGGTPAQPAGVTRLFKHRGDVYLRACLKLCTIHLMGKFEKNSTGFVLVKLTLRMFNSCLECIPLRSWDRLDKRVVLFVLRRGWGGRRCGAGSQAWCSGTHGSGGPPAPHLNKPFALPADQVAEGLPDGIPAAGTSLGANCPFVDHSVARPASFFSLNQPSPSHFHRPASRRKNQKPQEGGCGGWDPRSLCGRQPVALEST